ncbi:MAG TPA: GNAT family N-acetyltransferase [Nocardioidaceae bacterium]|nr:GNAT family N-acetyltransferase [Nocardioidaceae bacterium]
MTDADIFAVLSLNAHSVDVTGPLDADRLADIRSMAVRADVVEVDGWIAAFALVLPPDAAYDSANFAWFKQRYGDDFLYLDRVVVSELHRRSGIGGRIYDAAESDAAALGRLTCEVNAEPPNEASLAFHAHRGYVEAGRLAQDSGKVTAMFVKELS